MMEKTYAVSTKTATPTGDQWHSQPIGHDMAMMILVHNGWTEEQAETDLAGCPDKWIPVNDCCQIC